MTARELREHLEKLLNDLEEHMKLYSESFGPTRRDYPEQNFGRLQRQAIALIRQVGALRPYLEYFHDSWIAGSHGHAWNILDTGISTQSIRIVRGPSMRMLAEQVHSIIGRLSLMRDDEIVPLGTSPTGLADDELVFYLCSRLGRAAKILKERRQGKPPFEVADEYDVQDLLHALLRAYIKNAVRENPLPKIAGGPSSRADLCIEELGILIEMKYVRSPNDQNDIVKQLSEDMVLYTAWEHCVF